MLAIVTVQGNCLFLQGARIGNVVQDRRSRLHQQIRSCAALDTKYEQAIRRYYPEVRAPFILSAVLLPAPPNEALFCHYEMIYLGLAVKPTT